MLRNRQRELSIAVAILAIAAVLAGFAPEFLHFRQRARPAAGQCPRPDRRVGMTLIVITAQIDISVGSQFAICSVAAGVFAISGLPMFAALIAAPLLAHCWAPSTARWSRGCGFPRSSSPSPPWSPSATACAG
jgi:ribose/xylose/arabinose/galactoside ABC-type transport system permease subunit